MPNKVLTFLEHAGQQIAKGVKVALTKVVPVLAKDAQEAEPLLDLALPAEGPIFNTVTNAVVATEAAYAAQGAQSGTGAQKLASVLSACESTLLPALNKAGLTGAAATQAATNYINAVVQIANGPAVAAAAPAAAPATATS
jgi:translation elongation factor EF-4